VAGLPELFSSPLQHLSSNNESRCQRLWGDQNDDNYNIKRITDTLTANYCSAIAGKIQILNIPSWSRGHILWISLSIGQRFQQNTYRIPIYIRTIFFGILQYFIIRYGYLSLSYCIYTGKILSFIYNLL